VVRLGSDDTDGEAMVADLYLRPGAGGPREHVHGYLHGSFEVLEGRVGFRLDGMAAAGGDRAIDPRCLGLARRRPVG
jgi:hypothetical protein